ncbi:class I SAM-dependent methyltransferase [Brevundimonas diminuta]|uniref:class I SAM-dependent methyltransferase n=1 Tax=Brevundimonas TaxID=41275 RepID=UPI00168ACD85|nr:class I SAM-dependent methyltransferase [Brevundimonas diminuta]MBD3574343.1 class I SAM-dependent methyltransferase [Brevundimonas diminuta]
MTNIETTSAHWDAKYAAATQSAWVQNPLVAEALYYRMTGQRGYWLDWVFSQLVGPVQNLLSVGCGDGGHELLMARRGFAENVVAFDAAPDAIKRAQETAVAEGLPIEFSNLLFEEFVLNQGPENKYDAVFFSGSLHHVTDLEGMLSAVQKVLRPGGKVIVNEYCGPCYQLYPPHQVEIVDRTIASLPEEFRSSDRLELPNMQMIMASDPTEGVRSALIPKLVPMYFEPEYERFVGGALLHPLFSCLNASRVNDGSPESNLLVRMLIFLEDELTRSGALQHDFMLGVYANTLK